MTSTTVSNKLGEFMLKGWVLTDEICASEGCYIPLMRSPKGTSPSTMFCASCDGDPGDTASGSMIQNRITRQTSPSLTHSTSTRMSRSSTPPTDISSALSSPTFAPPIDTAETLRRRQQSDAASSEIGKRLLKGWAMLADECPNARCYGIPLVRPPLAGGGKDPRKECVSCGTVYVDEKDALGWDRLVPVSEPEPSNDASAAGPNVAAEVTESASLLRLPSQSLVNGTIKAKPKSLEQVPDGSILSVSTTGRTRRNSFVPVAHHQKIGSLDDSVLESATASLEAALVSLSQRLTTQTSHPISVEPSAICNTAEAMGKILQVMAQVKELRGDIGSVGQ